MNFDPNAKIERLERAYARAREARRLAESILEQKSRELFLLNEELEQRVRKRTEELEAARDQALTAARLRDEFVANMSHEMRTPLNGILGAIHLLGETPLDAEQRGHVDTVRSAGHELLGLVSDIFDFSLLAEGKIVLEPTGVRLADLITAAVVEVQAIAQAKRLHFATSIDPNVPECIVADARRMVQILVNLLKNAIKFTQVGCIGLEVTAKRATNELMFRIADSGVGIAADRIPMLFDAFTQGDGSMTRRHGGTGLGLAIVSGLVDLIGGRINVKSILGQGSTFTVVLPLVAVDASALEPGPDATSDAAPHARSLARLAGHVLVVEDNVMNQRVIAALLKKIGLTFDVVSDGEEAVRAWSRRPYDLILMDCQMPVMDGLEATQRIRAAEADGATIPIVALTANALDDDRRRCFAVGMNDFLTKPVNPAKLRRALAKWLTADAPAD